MLSATPKRRIACPREEAETKTFASDHRRWAVVLSLVLAACTTAEPAETQSPIPNTTAAVATSQVTTIPSSSTAPDDLAAELVKSFGPNFNGSALVARNGEIIFSQGFGMADDENGIPNTPETRFRIGSITKQFTGMSILILESRGLITSGDTVCQYLPDCPEGWDDITLEHLLGHTSGVFSFTDRPSFDFTEAATPAETVKSVSDEPLSWKPGQNFRYNNTGYIMLGMVIEAVSGMSYEEFVEQNIFGPLGMSDSGYEHGDEGLAVGYSSGYEPAAALDMSVPYAAGGLYSTVLDLLLWDEALYTEKLVPAEYLEKMFTPLVTITEQTGVGYAYGVAVRLRNGSPIFHSGGINGFISYYARYPHDHISVILLTNREDGPNLELFSAFAAQKAGIE